MAALGLPRVLFVDFVVAILALFLWFILIRGKSDYFGITCVVCKFLPLGKRCVWKREGLVWMDRLEDSWMEISSVLLIFFPMLFDITRRPICRCVIDYAMGESVRVLNG